MIDIISNFWNDLDAIERKVVAERIAKEKIISIRTRMTREQRQTIIAQSLVSAAMQLEILGDDIADEDLLAFLDAFDARLARRRFALRMRLGLIYLAGVMGRTLP